MIPFFGTVRNVSKHRLTEYKNVTKKIKAKDEVGKHFGWTGVAGMKGVTGMKGVKGVACTAAAFTV